MVAQRRHRARLIKPRDCDGRIRRLARDRLGDACVDKLTRAMLDYPVPLPVAGLGRPMYSYRGEFMPPMAGGGFNDLSDLIAEATGGSGNAGTIKQQTIPFSNIGTLATTGAEDHWYLQGMPGSGATPANLSAGGTVPTRTTPGALKQDNAGAGDTLHIVSAVAVAAGNSGILVVYDRLWHAATTMNSTALQTTTGAPTRYTGAASKGNVIIPVVRTTLTAIAHNNTIGYVDDAGNASETSLFAGASSTANANRVDYGNVNMWFHPLNAGDLGVREVDSYQSSALIAAGQLDIVLARPLVIIPLPASFQPGVLDGVNSMYNLVRILDDAALNFLTLRSGGSVQAVSGMLVAVSG